MEENYPERKKKFNWTNTGDSCIRESDVELQKHESNKIQYKTDNFYPWIKHIK